MVIKERLKRIEVWVNKELSNDTNVRLSFDFLEESNEIVVEGHLYLIQYDEFIKEVFVNLNREKIFEIVSRYLKASLNLKNSDDLSIRRDEINKNKMYIYIETIEDELQEFKDYLVIDKLFSKAVLEEREPFYYSITEEMQNSLLGLFNFVQLKIYNKFDNVILYDEETFEFKKIKYGDLTPEYEVLNIFDLLDCEYVESLGEIKKFNSHSKEVSSIILRQDWFLNLKNRMVIDL